MDGRPVPVHGRASNWASAHRTIAGQTSILAVAIRDAWQNAPNAYRLDGKDLYVELWPSSAYAGPLDLAPESIVKRWYGGEVGLDGKVNELDDGTERSVDGIRQWYCSHLKVGENARDATASDAFGVAKTHEIWFEMDVYDGSVPDLGPRLSLQADHPVFALSDPAHNCSTDALGRLHPEDSDRFPGAEAAIEAIFDQFLRWQNQWRVYGWNIYGDVHTYASARAQNAAGSLPETHLPDFKRAWAASHYGFPKVPWTLFFRSGKRKYLEFAEANSRHVMDLDRCHHGDLPEVVPIEPANPDSLLELEQDFVSEDDTSDRGLSCSCGSLTLDRLRRFRGHHFWDEATLILGDGYPILSNYEVLEFMPYGAYLRGYARGLDVLRDWYEAVCRFHHMDGVAGVDENEAWLRLFYFKTQVENAYKSHLDDDAERFSTEPFEQVRHIAAPLGNIVEWGRADGLRLDEAEEWCRLITDHVESLIEIFLPSGEETVDNPDLWDKLRNEEFREFAFKLRHAWGALDNARRLLEESQAAGTLPTEEGAETCTLEASHVAKFRSLLVEWARRTATEVYDPPLYSPDGEPINAIGYDGHYSFGDAAFGLLPDPESPLSADQEAAIREDVFDIGIARMNLLLSRTNTQKDGWILDGVPAPDCASLPDWRELYGPRGSGAVSSIQDTYTLETLPLFLRSIVDSEGLVRHDSWFRLVGPRFPTVRAAVTDTAGWRLKVRLAARQSMAVTSGDTTLTFAWERFYSGSNVEFIPIDPTGIVRLEEHLDGSVDLTITFDSTNTLDEGTSAHQRAVVDFLRVEGTDLTIEAQEETEAQWKTATRGNSLLPYDSAVKVFRAFGRRFWFDVPQGLQRLCVTLYVGYQHASFPYHPVLNVYGPCVGEECESSAAAYSGQAKDLTITDDSVGLSGAYAQMHRVDVEIPEPNAGVWSLGPVAHMADPSRAGDNTDKTCTADSIGQWCEERRGDIGFRTWVTIQFDTEFATEFLPSRPEGSDCEQ